MSTEQNKATLRRHYNEVMEQGKLEVVDQIFAPNFVDHDEDNPTHDLAGAKQFFVMARSALPDNTTRVEDMVAEGDRVVARITVSGTHRGEFMGTPPTGRHITFPGIDIVRCAEGKIVEHWSLYDKMGLLQQLGVLPAQTPG
ncbi:MAG: ester cyclase [Chloroflexi bacterium]|nr:ester cyclase [Chloroflexota bacterium]